MITKSKSKDPKTTSNREVNQTLMPPEQMAVDPQIPEIKSILEETTQLGNMATETQEMGNIGEEISSMGTTTTITKIMEIIGITVIEKVVTIKGEVVTIIITTMAEVDTTIIISASTNMTNIRRKTREQSSKILMRMFQKQIKIKNGNMINMIK